MHHIFCFCLCFDIYQAMGSDLTIPLKYEIVAMIILGTPF